MTWTARAFAKALVAVGDVSGARPTVDETAALTGTVPDTVDWLLDAETSILLAEDEADVALERRSRSCGRCASAEARKDVAAQVWRVARASAPRRSAAPKRWSRPAGSWRPSTPRCSCASPTSPPGSRRCARAAAPDPPRAPTAIRGLGLAGGLRASPRAARVPAGGPRRRPGYRRPGRGRRRARGVPARGRAQARRARTVRAAVPGAVRRPRRRSADVLRVLEEIARYDSSVAITLEAAVGLGANTIHRFGTEKQKQRWLAPMARGPRSARSA